MMSLTKKFKNFLISIQKSRVPGVSSMKNCVPQVFKWFVTHLFKGILASLINETQGPFFVSQRVSKNAFLETLCGLKNLFF